MRNRFGNSYYILPTEFSNSFYQYDDNSIFKKKTNWKLCDVTIPNCWTVHEWVGESRRLTHAGK